MLLVGKEKDREGWEASIERAMAAQGRAGQADLVRPEAMSVVKKEGFVEAVRMKVRG